MSNERFELESGYWNRRTILGTLIGAGSRRRSARAKLLIYQTTEGSNLGSDSHLMIFLPSLWFSNEGINACEPEFEFRRLCRVGWLLRV
jgi:hypothetical protein